ncbi:hypothetical protein F1880_009748 [Penicillium rolfsii]|nr:hypothetical protein F1880_009748 [Penicillium rolfsii]
MSKTRSGKWGSHEEAAARALKESIVTLDNERLIRTHHRTLGPCPFVYETTEAGGKSIWVVSIGPNVPVYDTHAGGREIHIHPEYLLPQLSKVYSGSRPDPLRRRINPRRFLTASDLELLRRFFPAAVGARVLISEFIIILFQTRKDIEASWLEGCVPSFGLLRLGYGIAVHYPTVAVADSGNAVADSGNAVADSGNAVADSGNAVADSPEKSEPLTSLGLKLRFADDSQGIAVATHGFVDLRTAQGNIAHKEKSWLAKIKSKFSKATAMNIKERIKTGAAVDSPLGKSVWFVQEPKEKIGYVTTTYDHHVARSSTFPQTIDHDTSIVTGSHLPKVLNPPRAPKIIGWANYHDALDGQLSFTMALRALSETPKQKSRMDPFGTMQKAVVEGTEYLWNRKARTQSAALLWRAMHDGTEMEGLSGSVLCLGEPTDPNCRAVLFKHFETPISPQYFHVSNVASARGDTSWSSINGGFVLPPEVRTAEIICETDESTGLPPADQVWDIE